MAMSGVEFCPLFTTKLQEVNAVIRTSNSSGERVACWDSIVQKLRDAGLAWSAQVAPEFVGVHPDNRSSLGVGGSESHHHGAEILKAGFSWRLASDATAVEAPPAPYDAAAQESNKQLAALSDGLLPPVSQLKLLSVGGGHTNSFLRAVKAHCRSAVASLQDSEGKLSAAALCVGRPAFEEAVNKGLRWTVLHWQVPVAFPGIVHLAQAALNTHSKGENGEIECLLELNRQRAFYLGQGVKEVPWADIISGVARGLPSCGPWLQTLADFVQICPAELLNELSLFQKVFACTENGARRELGSDYFAKVVSLNFGPAEKFPLLKLACIEGNLAAPVHKVKDGRCEMLTPSSLAVLVSPKQRDNVRKAEALMRDARALCEAMKVEQAIRVKMVGRFDARVVYHLCGKTKDAEGKTYNDLAEILEVFLKELSAAIGVDALSMDSLAGGSDTPATSPQAIEADTVQDLQDVNLQARRAGFKPGAAVAMKKSDELVLWKILDISSEEAKLGQLEDGRVVGEEKKVPTIEFLAAWRLHKGKVTSLLPGWVAEQKTGSPLQSVGWATECVKGAAALAFRQRLGEHEDLTQHLELLTNPSAVKATKHFAKGTLVLIGATQKVERAKANALTNASAVGIGSFSAPAGSEPVCFQALPQFVPPLSQSGEASKQPWVAPFWCVEVVKDPAAANIELQFQETKVGEFNIQVPVLINKCPVKNGERLSWHCHKESAKRAPPRPKAGAASKKAKTG